MARSVLSIGLCFAFLSPALGSSIVYGDFRLNDFWVVFPQVERGTSGDLDIETTIILSHPFRGPGDPTEVVVRSTDGELLAPMNFQLDPGATRTIEISGGELHSGVVIVGASRQLGAAANLVIRRSGEITSQVSVPARRLGGHVLIPVLFRDEGKSHVENTGIAVLFDRPGFYRADLLDPEGNLVDSRGFLIRDPSEDLHTAAFIDEWFELPDGFTIGSVAFYSNWLQPFAFAVTALYSKSEQLWAAEVSEIRSDGSYNVTLISEGPDVPDLQELAGQYG